MGVKIITSLSPMPLSLAFLCKVLIVTRMRLGVKSETFKKPGVKSRTLTFFSFY